MLKKRKKESASHSRIFWITGLLGFVLVASAWLIWYNTYVRFPRLNFMVLRVNQEPRKVLSGDFLALHPGDKVKILEVSTNIFLNQEVRLAARGLDVAALQYEEMSLSTLLPDQEIFDRYKFRIYIKHYNHVLGYVDCEVQPYVEDWLDKADRTIKADQRLEVLKRAMDLLPEDSRIEQRLLDEYISQRLWKQAALMLEEMAREDRSRELLIQLYEVYSSIPGEDGTLSVLKRLVKLDPKDMESRSRLAEVLEKKGNCKGAIKEYEALLNLVDQSDRTYIYKHLGYLYTRILQHKKAISFYVKAAKSDQKDANLHYNLSYLYNKVGQKERSEFHLSQAVSLASDDVEGRLELAKRFFDKGKLKKAEEYLKEILKKDSNSLNALLLMAKIQEKQGKRRALRKTYSKILAINPEDETIVYNLGAIEYELRNWKACVRHFKKYVKSHPKDRGAHNILFNTYKRLKDERMAYEEAQILVGLKPEDTGCYNYIFDYLNRRGNYEEIINVMKKGLKFNPKQTKLREYMVTAYLETGKEAQAIKQMEQILRVRPEDTGLLLRMAGLLEKRAEFAEALDVYERVIDISSGNEEAEEAYLRLRLRGVQGGGTK